MLAISAEFQKSYLGETSPVMDQVHLRARLDYFLANYAEGPVHLGRAEHRHGRGLDRPVPGWGKKDMALATLARLPGRD